MTTISRVMVTTGHSLQNGNNHHTYIQYISDRILYGNVCMIVCLVGFSYLIPGIHQSPRWQEEADHLCATIDSCSMKGSQAILTQQQRRDTQTLRRAEKDHIVSDKVRSTHNYADLCIMQSDRVV